MIPAVSNIAWRAEEADAAYALLRAHGVTGLEIAPALFLDGAEDPFEPDEETLRRAVDRMRTAGLRLVSMQSLLFGVEGAALFGDLGEQARFVTGMERAIGLAGRLGIPNLVFGSPKQRIVPEHMTQEDALGLAAEVFTRLGDRARTAGTTLSLEANPTLYGTNFLTDTPEAAALVARIDHPAIGLVLDLGTMHVNTAFARPDPLPDTVLHRVTHVHVSEPALAPAPAATAPLAAVLSRLAGSGYTGAVSIEMARDAKGLEALDAALSRFAAAAGEACMPWTT